MIRVQMPDDLDDLALGCAVDFADVVIPALGDHLQGFEPGNGPYDDFARGARGADGNIEKRVHGK